MPQIPQGCFPLSLALALAQPNLRKQVALLAVPERADCHQCDEFVLELSGLMKEKK
jgi:hypothetical protein